jgi:phenylpyruvate tautomerase PptA (4-oxalocrotonate tautomerase family)
MPISIQVTRGLLTPAGQREIFPRVAEALLEAHGLENSAFMRENVIGHVMTSDPESSYVDGKPQSLAIVEVKVPGVAFRERSTQQRFVETVTRIVDELKAADHPRRRTFVNVTHAVDGAWGIAGKAYTNADLGAAIQASLAR